MKISDEDLKSYQLGDYQLIRYLIPRTDVVSNVWQTVKKNYRTNLGSERVNYLQKHLEPQKFSIWA